MMLERTDVLVREVLDRMFGIGECDFGRMNDHIYLTVPLHKMRSATGNYGLRADERVSLGVDDVDIMVDDYGLTINFGRVGRHLKIPSSVELDKDRIDAVCRNGILDIVAWYKRVE